MPYDIVHRLGKRHVDNEVFKRGLFGHVFDRNARRYARFGFRAVNGSVYSLRRKLVCRYIYLTVLFDERETLVERNFYVVQIDIISFRPCAMEPDLELAVVIKVCDNGRGIRSAAVSDGVCRVIVLGRISVYIPVIYGLVVNKEIILRVHIMVAENSALIGSVIICA